MTRRPPTTECAYLEARLEALSDPGVDLAGLGRAERAACAEHLAGCAACRELVELARLPLAAEADDAPAAAPEPPQGLVAAVLARTSGPACRRAGELLAGLGWPAGLADPSAADHALLDLHLESCAECRRLAATLSALARDLPALAEVAPDPEFVSAVLAATSGRPAPIPPTPAGSRFIDPWVARGERVWAAWVRRPRFALEAAYVGLLACLLVAGAPAVSLAEPAREVGRTLSEPPRLSSQLEALAPAAGAVRAGAAELDNRWQALVGDLEAVAETGPELGAALLQAVGDAIGDRTERVERTFRAVRASLSSKLAGGAGETEPPPSATDEPNQESP